MLAYLDQIGVRPGAEVSVKDVAPLEGPLTIETDDGITPLGRGLHRSFASPSTLDLACCEGTDWKHYLSLYLISRPLGALAPLILACPRSILKRLERALIRNEVIEMYQPTTEPS